MSSAYRTLDEYHALMMEAQIEFYEWEQESKRSRKQKKEKFKDLRTAKLEARKLFG